MFELNNSMYGINFYESCRYLIFFCLTPWISLLVEKIKDK
jgi:hypothetical protein